MPEIKLNATVVGRAHADAPKDEKGEPTQVSALSDVRLTLHVPAAQPAEFSFNVPVLGLDELKQGTEVVVTIQEKVVVVVEPEHIPAHV